MILCRDRRIARRAENFRNRKRIRARVSAIPFRAECRTRFGRGCKTKNPLTIERIPAELRRTFAHRSRVPALTS